jgi:cell wall-associated NlpC family hydrolase
VKIHWAAKYIGIPYKPCARGPEEVDCWGLVYLVYKTEFGIELPLYPGVSMLKPVEAMRTISMALQTEWIELQKPFDGCVVTMSQAKEMHHIGLYVEEQGGMVLHTMNNLSTIASPLRQLKNRYLLRRVQFYKYFLWHLPTSSKPQTP